MIMPRFTIRTALIGVSICAVVFVIMGMAVQGESWAWGITIGLVSLVVTLLVHVGCYGIVTLFGRLPVSSQTISAQAVAAATSILPPGDMSDAPTHDRVEANP